VAADLHKPPELWVGLGVSVLAVLALPPLLAIAATPEARSDGVRVGRPLHTAIGMSQTLVPPRRRPWQFRKFTGSRRAPASHGSPFSSATRRTAPRRGGSATPGGERASQSYTWSLWLACLPKAAGVAPRPARAGPCRRRVRRDATARPKNLLPAEQPRARRPAPERTRGGLADSPLEVARAGLGGYTPTSIHLSRESCLSATASESPEKTRLSDSSGSADIS